MRWFFFFPSRSTCSHIQGNVLQVLTGRVESNVLIAVVSFIFTSNDLDHLASFFFFNQALPASLFQPNYNTLRMFSLCVSLSFIYTCTHTCTDRQEECRKSLGEAGLDVFTLGQWLEEDGCALLWIPGSSATWSHGVASDDYCWTFLPTAVPLNSIS